MTTGDKADSLTSDGLFIDWIGFNPYIEQYSRLLADAGDDGITLFLDAPYGAGKTTFIEMWVRHLADNAGQGDWQDVDLKLAFIDCWAADYLPDPAMLVANAVKNPIPMEKLAAGIAFNLADFAAKYMTGTSLREIKDLLEVPENLPDAYQEALLTENFFESFKERYKASHGKDADGRAHHVVFIDELDRCRPAFALRVLERLKQLQELPRLSLVIAAHGDQLRHSVNHEYGADFDAGNFMERFRDIVVTVPRADLPAFFQKLVPGWQLEPRLGTCTNLYGAHYDLRNMIEDFIPATELAVCRTWML